MIDISKSEKIPPERRYFNISVLWIFYYHHLLRPLYRLRIPHEAVTLASIASGVVSALLFYCGSVLPAAVALHLKDLLDACGGSLARLTGRGHLIGRYLDSLGDFLVLVLVSVAIAHRAYVEGSSIYLFWGGTAILSIFIQCSFFNFYQIAYLERFGIQTVTSKRDEYSRDDAFLPADSLLKRIVLSLLRFAHIIIYSWQDKFVAAVDNHLYKRCNHQSRANWYGDKRLMTLQSALCFGTHTFVVIVFALLNHTEYALVFVATMMNLYLLWLLYYRRKRFAGAATVVVSEANANDRKRM